MRRRFHAQTALIPIAVLLGLLLSAVPAVAAGPAGFPLMEGYTFTDTQAHPGISCYYGSNNSSSQDLIKIVTKSPRLYARDRTAGVDHQKVAWRFVIEGAKGGSPPWKNYYHSSWLTATADDSVGHKFGARTWYRMAPTPLNRQWKVHEELRFYKPGSSTVVESTIKFFAQWATIKWPPFADSTNPTLCLPGM